MDVVELQRVADCSHLLGKQPSESEFDQVISKECTLVSEGKLVGLYTKLPRDLLSKLRTVACKTKPTKGKRTLGLPTASSIFGFLPRNPVRSDYCRLSGDSIKDANLLGAVQNCSRQISNIYKEVLPDQFKSQSLASAGISSEWKIEGTPFTTCNFNKNTAIKYHRDKANQKGVFSSVIIVRRDVTGGELVLPEYRTALAQRDGAVLLFDGQREIHGVCPVAKKKRAGYRFSIVLYAMQQMENCYPYADEIERRKVKRTEKESRWRPSLEQLGPERGLGKIK